MLSLEHIRSLHHKAKSNIIAKEEAILKLSPDIIISYLFPSLVGKSIRNSIAHGTPASPGAAAGKAVFTSEDAYLFELKGIPTILICRETSSKDVVGMRSAKGILTIKGGVSSHSAIIARILGKPCVVGCSDIALGHEDENSVRGKYCIEEYEWITIDGNSGSIYRGQLDISLLQWPDELLEMISWADNFRSMCVRANADTAEDIAIARNFGADGVGVCRTEHMFFGNERLPLMRELLFSLPEDNTISTLEKLQIFQQEDFINIFIAMDGLPVTIRLLDAPLHEFSSIYGTQCEVPGSGPVEHNPMLGFRGCRMAIVNPEITKMQARAIFRAAKAASELGTSVIPEIMVPMVCDAQEMRLQRSIIKAVAEEELRNSDIAITVGSMIEIPRAALLAEDIAAISDFFSFGTNDLTQLTLGVSRDDSVRYMPSYLDCNVFNTDPFVTIDKYGVGQLVEMAITKGRSVNRNIKIGICGEHGGDPESIYYFHKLGLDYISCSPYRIPIARLVAAQAAIIDI